MLAAIHDCFCKGVERIGPWPEVYTDKVSRNSESESMAYVVLCHNVENGFVKPQAQRLIESVLRDVAEDLSRKQACGDKRCQRGLAHGQANVGAQTIADSHRLGADPSLMHMTESPAISISAKLYQRNLRRAMELVESLILACGPPSDAAQTQELSEFWFNLDEVQQLAVGLHNLRLGTYAVELQQEAHRAEMARARAHGSTIRKVGGWETSNHSFLMLAENGDRIGLSVTLKKIQRELDWLNSQCTHNSTWGSEAVQAAIQWKGVGQDNILDLAVLKLSEVSENEGLSIQENSDWLTADILLVFDQRRWIMWQQHDGTWTNAFVDNWPKFLSTNPKLRIKLSPAGRGRAAEFRLAGQENKARDQAGHRRKKEPSKQRSKPWPRSMPTSRELQALELRSRGLSIAAIGREMGLSKSRAGQLLTSAAKRPEAPSRSINLGKAESLLDHDSTAPKSKKRSRPPRRT